MNGNSVWISFNLIHSHKKYYDTLFGLIYSSHSRASATKATYKEYNKSICIAFIDYNKAYRPLEHNTISTALKTQGIKTNI